MAHATGHAHGRKRGLGFCLAWIVEVAQLAQCFVQCDRLSCGIVRRCVVGVRSKLGNELRSQPRLK